MCCVLCCRMWLQYVHTADGCVFVFVCVLPCSPATWEWHGLSGYAQPLPWRFRNTRVSCRLGFPVHCSTARLLGAFSVSSFWLVAWEDLRQARALYVCMQARRVEATVSASQGPVSCQLVHPPCLGEAATGCLPSGPPLATVMLGQRWCLNSGVGVVESQGAGACCAAGSLPKLCVA